MLVRWFYEGFDVFKQTCSTGRIVYNSSYEQLLSFLAALIE